MENTSILNIFQKGERSSILNPAGMKIANETIFFLREVDYEKKLIGAIHSKARASHIIRSRREVVQHALALNFLITEMVERRDLLYSCPPFIEKHVSFRGSINLAPLIKARKSFRKQFTMKM